MLCVCTFSQYHICRSPVVILYVSCRRNIKLKSVICRRVKHSMPTFTYSYADSLSLTWTVECMASFLTARELALLCSACSVLGNTRGEYVRAALKAQHGCEQYQYSCLATLNHLRMLECIPESCVINELESLEGSWMMRIPLRRGRYCLLVYGWTHRFHETLDLFLNTKRIIPERYGGWIYSEELQRQAYRCRVQHITIGSSGHHYLMCLVRITDVTNGIFNCARVRLTRICFVPD